VPECLIRSIVLGAMVIAVVKDLWSYPV